MSLVEKPYLKHFVILMPVYYKFVYTDFISIELILWHQPKTLSYLFCFKKPTLVVYKGVEKQGFYQKVPFISSPLLIPVSLFQKELNHII